MKVYNCMFKDRRTSNNDGGLKANSMIKCQSNWEEIEGDWSCTNDYLSLTDTLSSEVGIRAIVTKTFPVLENAENSLLASAWLTERRWGFFPSSSALHVQIIINKIIIQWQPHVRNLSIWAGGSCRRAPGKRRVTLQAIRRLRKRTSAFRRLPADKWGTLWIVTRVITTSYKTRLDFITQEVQAFLHFWVFDLSLRCTLLSFFSIGKLRNANFPPFEVRRCLFFAPESLCKPFSKIDVWNVPEDAFHIHGPPEPTLETSKTRLNGNH